MRIPHRFLLIACLTVLAAHAAGALDYRATTTVDWHRRIVVMEVQAPIPTSGRNLAAAEHSVRREIERDLPQILQEALLAVRLDEGRTVSDLLDQNLELAASLPGVVAGARRVRVHRTPDLHEVVAEYHLPLFPELAQIVITHGDPTPLPRSVSWVPTRRYTGIVIVADTPLPIHGTRRQGLAVPAMMPRIFDRTMRTVLSFDMVPSDVVRTSGMVRYTDNAQDPMIQTVAGDDPLYIVATGLFGTTVTDLLIPTDAADRILFSDSNRELLRSGQVVVVVPAQNLRETTQIRPRVH
ncbi:MAG: hypothetical protein EA403_08510 [Spirochaetaceae bacterium]|nr:MAG: hypothetical protein EA403_08510 [Spirochaetaceae bacterium]